MRVIVRRISNTCGEGQYPRPRKWRSVVSSVELRRKVGRSLGAVGERARIFAGGRSISVRSSERRSRTAGSRICNKATANF